MSLPTKLTSYTVAVIGAGASGLVVGRELQRQGHKVVIFERSNSIGGTWVYNPSTESDPLGLDPSRAHIHSSLYYTLRTNLPRECMGFHDYPFAATPAVAYGGERDLRRFPSHREVLHYLEDFAREFDIVRLVRFEREVFHVGLSMDGRWTIRSRRSQIDGCDEVVNGDDESEVYDAVVVCSGHYTKPRIAQIPGIDLWPGKQIHSHNYRVPEPFQDQVVVVIGASASAVDISRDIYNVAKEVHMSARSVSKQKSARKVPGFENMWQHSMIESAHSDGTIVFQDGSSVRADVILHCTGYDYHFPFLKINDIVTVDDNCVGPLYKHIFPPSLAPWLSFIGIPWMFIPFPFFEMQSKWVASVLSGQVSLPSYEEMMEDVKAFHSKLDAAGVPKRYTHNISDYEFDYHDWLASECGYPPTEAWRKKMLAMTRENWIMRPETYRDEWDDDDLVLEANEDFLKHHKI